MKTLIKNGTIITASEYCRADLLAGLLIFVAAGVLLAVAGALINYEKKIGVV